jgi:hypothetical protein
VAVPIAGGRRTRQGRTTNPQSGDSDHPSNCRLFSRTRLTPPAARVACRSQSGAPRALLFDDLDVDKLLDLLGRRLASLD